MRIRSLTRVIKLIKLVISAITAIITWIAINQYADITISVATAVVAGAVMYIILERII